MKKKSKPLKLLEYAGVYIIILIARAIPLSGVWFISGLLGNLLYLLSKKRRTIAIENLRHVYSGEKTDRKIKTIARESCRSFFLTFLEIVKLRRIFTEPVPISTLKQKTQNVEQLFKKAKKIHDESNGCIFVTPHFGSWELLPYVSSSAGIPLVVVVRPLDNEYLEKLIYKTRSASGQLIIPKKNALFVLQKTLRQGKSIGMLPDQSTMKGISVDFFGRKATTTPVPAILAVTYKRPIVVVACCRVFGTSRYEGFVSDPIMPGQYTNEKTEIFRLTHEMNRQMEEIILKYPEQYLWIHNRWKTYRHKRELLS
jgi:KDO2-lipid IV(A) lauroyltransferase